MYTVIHYNNCEPGMFKCTGFLALNYTMRKLSTVWLIGVVMFGSTVCATGIYYVKL